jgi:putative sporulation protein YtaF
MLSIQIINIICCVTIGLAMLLGHWLKPYLPEGLAIWLAFAVLFAIGLVKLLDGIVKTIIRKYTKLDKAFKFSIFDIKFMLRLYADPEVADSDVSAHLSPAEAVVLAVSLSLDGMAVGFAAALAGVNPWAVMIWSLVTNFAALMLGRRLGHKLADALPFNISWLAGVVLIILAFSRLA